MKLKGKVSWYDKRDGLGIVVDTNGNEYYIDESVLNGITFVDYDQPVTFEKNTAITHTNCAKNVELDFQEVARVNRLRNAAPELLEACELAMEEFLSDPESKVTTTLARAITMAKGNHE